MDERQKSANQKEKNQDACRNDIAVRGVRLGTLVAAGAIAVIGAILALTLLSIFRPDNSLGLLLRKYIPIPVAIIDGAFVTHGELDRDRDSLRRFYESQSDKLAESGLRVDFNTDDGKKRLLMREKDILNKLIEDRVIMALAEQRGIKISSEEVHVRVEEVVSKDDGSMDRFRDRLYAAYGWNIEEFESRIVRPALYQEELEELFGAERNSTEARKKIGDALEFIQQGNSFGDAAKRFSDGISRENGGDLGTVEISSLIPELQGPARTQEIGVVGGVIESLLGYHVLLVVGRSQESEVEVASLKQVFVAKPSFSDWITSEKQKSLVFILPRRYIWNRGNGMVEFRNNDLRVFEERSIQNADGDPSLIL